MKKQKITVLNFTVALITSVMLGIIGSAILYQALRILQ